MSFRIAFSGKGGSGKTTLAALTIRHLYKKTGKPVLAIDADPNSTLSFALGFTVTKTIAEIRDRITAEKDTMSPGVTKDRLFEYEMEASIEEGVECDLITMGRPEGPGCYCFLNNILRRSLSALGNKYPYLVLDNEAGMEHLSRRTTDNIDLLVLVAEPTHAGLETVLRLSEMISKLPVSIHKTVAVINKVPPGLNIDALKERIASSSLAYGGTIALDPEISRVALEGKPLMTLADENPSCKGIAALLDPYL